MKLTKNVIQDQRGGKSYIGVQLRDLSLINQI